MSCSSPACPVDSQEVDLARQTATFAGPDGALHELRYDLLVGADGVNSRVRCLLLIHDMPCASLQQSDWRPPSISRRACLSQVAHPFLASPSASIVPC